MSLSTINWIIAAPYLVLIGIALLVAAFCTGLVLLDTLIIAPLDKLPASVRDIVIGAVCVLAFLHGLGVLHFA